MSRGNSGQIGPYRQPTSGILTPAALQQAVVEALVVLVGGAASGAGNAGPGGGSGGVRTENLSLSRGVAYPIKIGLGGSGVVNAAGNNGQDSVLAGITALGGGKSGTTGGSGGGAPYSGSPGAGTSSQGSSGGTATTGAAGGGGSASEAGGNAVGTAAGKGGDATSTLITGIPIKLAAGGGSCGNGGASNGGSGIGGNGNNVANGTNGATNTGSGGGGGGVGYKGGDGADGVGYIRIPNNFTITFSAGVTSSMSTAVPGYKVYTITATATGSETFVIS